LTPRPDYEEIFMPLLHRISALLDNQIEQAVARKLVVKVSGSQACSSLYSDLINRKSFLWVGLPALLP
jgi:hypothetical protein